MCVYLHFRHALKCQNYGPNFRYYRQTWQGILKAKGQFGKQNGIENNRPISEHVRINLLFSIFF